MPSKSASPSADSSPLGSWVAPDYEVVARFDGFDDPDDVRRIGLEVAGLEAFAKKLKLLKAFGVDRTHGERKIPGVYDTVALGFNYRMSEIHAAIGIEQVKKLPGFLTVRKANFEALETGLAEGDDFLPAIEVLARPIADGQG